MRPSQRNGRLSNIHRIWLPVKVERQLVFLALGVVGGFGFMTNDAHSQGDRAYAEKADVRLPPQLTADPLLE